MVKIGICEDNLGLREQYQKLVMEISRCNGLKCEIILFDDGKEVIEYEKKNGAYLDILFLDFLTQSVSDIEIVPKLRKMRYKTLLVLLTTSEEYAFDTMEIKAFAYLMKDKITRGRFEKMLLSAIEKTEERKRDIFKIEKVDSSFQFAFRDICFIKIYNSFCYIHHWDGIILEHNNLEILNLIKEKIFFKRYENYIIGLHYIQKIEKKRVVLSDASHTVIPLKESHAKELKLAFTEYMISQLS